MRIWWINHYAVLPSQVGGTRHYSLARRLVEAGHEVTIIASRFNHFALRAVPDGSSSAEAQKYRLESIDGVEFLWIGTPAYKNNSLARLRNMTVFAARAARGARRMLQAPPDVVIGSSPHPFAALAAARIAKGFAVPFVLEIRDLWPQTLVDIGRFAAGHPLVRTLCRLERYLYQQASLIVTLLPRAAEHMEAKGAAAEKIHWIPNGIDLSLVPPSTPAPELSTFTILYAGSHGVANGLDSVLDAAAWLQRKGTEERTLSCPVLFRLLGDGPEKLRLRRRVERENLLNVRFEDPAPKERVYAAMADADAFIATLRASPLYRWGMSLNKLFDYLAMARPIVFGADVPQNPVAESGAGIVVAPEDSRAMAAAVATLVKMSPEARSDMGRRGREFVERHYDIKQLAQRLLSLLEGVVKREG